MGIEYVYLKKKVLPVMICPACDVIFSPLVRGLVTRAKRPWYKLFRRTPTCAVFCMSCKKLIGWEEASSAPEFYMWDVIRQYRNRVLYPHVRLPKDKRE